MAIPRGVKITAILLIVICGIQFLTFFLFGVGTAIKKGAGANTSIFSLFFMWSILPAMGLVSGIGLLRLITWARKLVLIFSTLSIVFYGLSIPISYTLMGSLTSSIFNIIFTLTYGCGLPLWSLYYFTRPHIKVLFATK